MRKICDHNRYAFVFTLPNKTQFQNTHLTQPQPVAFILNTHLNASSTTTRDMLHMQLAERINSRHYAALLYVTDWKLNSQMKLTQITNLPVLPSRLGARSQSASI
jgi:hypothetical protein